MKFIHFADCHLDGFRDFKLAQLGLANFKTVIQAAIDQKVNFVIIAGDLFNTAIPRVEALKTATEQLKRLADNNIPVYAIAGSHDYSPNGKTVLDVLELAGLLINVMKGEVTDDKHLRLEFTKDEKTGALITGIIGKKGMLDSAYYRNLNTTNLVGDGFKIFCFHTALEELKTKDLEHMQGHSLSMLPTGFDYYAGGHVHIVKRYSDHDYCNIVYPGPTFPNSFSELEKLKRGSYVLYDSSLKQPVSHQYIEPKTVRAFTINVNDLTASQAHDKIISQVNNIDQCIVLLRILGTLREGTVGDIQLDDVTKEIHKQGAFHVLRNTAKLQSMSFNEVEAPSGDVQTVEQETIKEHTGQIPLPGFDEKVIIDQLLCSLELEQHDGETRTTFHERVVEKGKEIFEKEN